MQEKDIYAEWSSICLNIVSNKIDEFKQLNEVQYMLEHVSKEHGKIYFDNLLKDGFDKEYLCYLSLLNDKHGSVKEEYDNILVSPSTIRYARHAFDICNLIQTKNLSNVSIVEIGGGYGGLCLILSDMLQKNNIKLDKYHILDLPEVQKLQEYYLNGAIPQLYFNNCMQFGSDINDDNLILVSCYAVSEMNIEYRLNYLKNLLPKVQGMYLLWNSENVDGLPFKALTKMKIEDPLTGPNNSVISL